MRPPTDAGGLRSLSETGHDGEHNVGAEVTRIHCQENPSTSSKTNYFKGDHLNSPLSMLVAWTRIVSGLLRERNDWFRSPSRYPRNSMAKDKGAAEMQTTMTNSRDLTRRWSPDKEASLLLHFGAGAKADEVAERLGRTGQAVYARLQRFEKQRGRTSKTSGESFVQLPKQSAWPRSV